MPRRTLVYSFLLLAAFLMGRWFTTAPSEPVVSQALAPVLLYMLWQFRPSVAVV